MSSSKRTYTRFIPREEVGAVTRWQFGAVNGEGWEPPPQQPAPGAPVGKTASAADPAQAPEEELAAHVPSGPTPEELQALLDQASEEAYARGQEEGVQRAQELAQQEIDDYRQEQGARMAERLGQIAQRYEDSLSGLQQSMAQGVLALACDIARQVVRRELSNPSQAMLPVVREALDMLQSETRPATVRLHPDDWALLEPQLRERFPAARIQWQADAGLQPGDCMVDSAGMTIDGTLDKRWRRAIAALGLTQAWKEADHGD